MDVTEGLRRELVEEINSGKIEPEGQEWTSVQLASEFEVLRFLAPYVVVRNKVTGKKGSLLFRHHPRVYFGWQEDK